jgi:hypothetical protein
VNSRITADSSRRHSTSTAASSIAPAARPSSWAARPLLTGAADPPVGGAPVGSCGGSVSRALPAPGEAAKRFGLAQFRCSARAKDLGALEVRVRRF